MVVVARARHELGNATPGHGFVGWRRRFGARRSSRPVAWPVSVAGYPVVEGCQSQTSERHLRVVIHLAGAIRCAEAEVFSGETQDGRQIR